MMETGLRTILGLYPRLLGDTWNRLDQAVRRLHNSLDPVHAVGVFRVRRGSNWLVRTLAQLAQLPQAGEAVDVRLLVTRHGQREEWRRTFAGRPLATLQFERAGGLLAERMGCLELWFRLKVVEGALAYQSTSAGFCFGSLRLPLPHWLSPRVRAREKSADADHQIDVAVEVRLPLLGLLIAYEGRLTPMEVR
jgi:hypothetical protein